MFILKKGHQPGVYVPLRALFLVLNAWLTGSTCGKNFHCQLPVFPILGNTPMTSRY